jgi:hypothetical protein
MAMTVTAVMSGTPANEHIYLWIRVYTSAAETGGASVASLNASGGASVTASLTPNFSGSLPLFALTADNWGGSYTAASNNTIDSGSNDSDSWGAGFGRYTGTVTGGTPLTFGASGVGGGCDYSTWACYELPGSGGSPSLDASSPALASATGSGIKTVTSASFTPPGGSVIVAMVCGGGTGTSGTFTISVSDTGGGLTWTKRAGNTTAADQNTAVFTATVGGGALAVTTASLPAAATGTAYSQTLAASGGTSPYTWSVSSGSLPSWASLDSGTGAITGTPTSGQPGSTFTVEVTDNVSATATQSLTLDVHLPVTLVGSVGKASGTSSPLTAVYGQTPAAGNLLLALVSAGSTTAETPNISTSAGGWSRLTSGSVGNNPAGTSKAIVDAWVKTAAGGDAAPTFTQTLSGSPELTCDMYELTGANLTSPLDVSGVQQTGSGTSTVTFSVATSAPVGGYGEFAVSVMAQERTSATLTWTETGTGWTSQGKLPASGASVLFAQSNSQAAPAPGSALTDAGHWSTQSTALGAALILVIAGSQVTSTSSTAAATSSAAGLVTQVITGRADGAAAAAGSAARYITGLAGTGAGYFADNTGSPRMIMGDAVWGLPGNAGRWSSGAWQSDFDTYFATRSGQGFTVAYTKPMGTTQNGGINDDGRVFDGLFPFQGGSLGNPSSGLTSSYWARIDYMLNSALAQGITVFLNAIGYDSDFETSGPLAGKSSTEFGAYGTALGGRYKDQPNLVWVVADDYFGGSTDTKISAFLTALRAAGDTHPISIENFPETTSRQDTSDGSATAWGAANAQYNWCYSYNVTYYGVEKAFAESSPICPLQGDGYFYQGGSSYAGGSGAFAYDRAIRQDAWHAISSGARGIIHGDEACWQWQSTAQASAAANWYFVNNAGKIRALMESLPGWQLLVPDTSSLLVTAGRGTHATGFSSGGGGGQYEVAFTDSYVTASRVADGSLAVIYLSHGTTITIDETKMGAGYTASWADPITGALSAATAGSTYNSTAKGNNSQGDPDWVLILQAAAVQGTATASAAATATGLVTDAVTATAAAAATATGTVTQGVTGTAAAASTAAGSVTQGNTAAGAGASTATGLATQGSTATAAAAATAAGTATVVTPGTATAAAAGTAAGLVTQACTGEGDASATAAALVSQQVTATAAGQGSATGAGSVAGSATAPAAAAAAGLVRQVVTGEADGQAAATGAGGAAGTATAAGAGTATGIVTEGVTAAAAATATAAGLVTQQATGEADGAGTAAGLAQQGSTATSDAIATASGSGTSTSGQHGEGDAVSAVTAVAVQGNTAAASSAAAASGAVTLPATAAAAGTAGAAGLVTQGATAAGTAASTASGSSSAAAAATGEADAAATAAGLSAVSTAVTAPAAGTAAGLVVLGVTATAPAAAGAAGLITLPSATATAAAAGTASGLATLTVTAAASGSSGASGSSAGTTAGTATAAASASVAEAFTLTASALAAALATATGSPKTSSPAAVLSGTAVAVSLSGSAAVTTGPGGSAAASDLEGAASIG